MSLNLIWISTIADVVTDLSAAAFASALAIPIATRKQKERSLQLLLFNLALGIVGLLLVVRLRTYSP